MASRTVVKTIYNLKCNIQPFHTGGKVSLDYKGNILATCVGEEVVLSNLQNGKELTRIEGVSTIAVPAERFNDKCRQDGEAITTLSCKNIN